ncbi:HEAT repeat domain-containing protein (plasmid) [Deinococcus sp. KNUC1210]|uniref:HEAT repeat domain-containing protein n=1 Tax=Deinococcus sp. KNUC1210 TaxID=2917691 RepID=UPI001EF044E9|nr:HEAT repeat domain-containing protein [Deinococcus sp. KNUC1210]ULH18267.1 HEAT repeat domain-containing protein [Deinococcus sp. KNUC1210]
MDNEPRHADGTRLLNDVSRLRILEMLKVHMQLEPDLFRSDLEFPDLELLEREFNQRWGDSLCFINSFDDNEIFPFLHDIFLNSDDPWSSGQALEAMVQLPHHDTLGLLADLLHHAQPEWRWVACSRLAERRGPEVTRLLCDTLLQDPDPDVRFNAAEALKTAGDETALPALEDAERYDSGTDYEGWPIAGAARAAIDAIAVTLQQSQTPAEA